MRVLRGQHTSNVYTPQQDTSARQVNLHITQKKLLCTASLQPIQTLYFS